MEKIIKVDINDNYVGEIEKLDAHTQPILHRAFSVFLYNGDKILIQRRAKNKYHSGGLWANSCCSHPRANKTFLQSVKERLKEEFKVIFSKYDALLSPLYPSSPPLCGSHVIDPESVYKNDSFTVPSSIVGLPALTLPCGKDSIGLPVGIQIIGKAFSEKKLYRIGFALESEITEACHE